MTYEQRKKQEEVEAAAPAQTRAFLAFVRGLSFTRAGLGKITAEATLSPWSAQWEYTPHFDVTVTLRHRSDTRETAISETFTYMVLENLKFPLPRTVLDLAALLTKRVLEEQVVIGSWNCETPRPAFGPTR